MAVAGGEHPGSARTDWGRRSWVDPRCFFGAFVLLCQFALPTLAMGRRIKHPLAFGVNDRRSRSPTPSAQSDNGEVGRNGEMPEVFEIFENLLKINWRRILFAMDPFDLLDPSESSGVRLFQQWTQHASRKRHSLRVR